MTLGQACEAQQHQRELLEDREADGSHPKAIDLPPIRQFPPLLSLQSELILVTRKCGA